MGLIVHYIVHKWFLTLRQVLYYIESWFPFRGKGFLWFMWSCDTWLWNPTTSIVWMFYFFQNMWTFFYLTSQWSYFRNIYKQSDHWLFKVCSRRWVSNLCTHWVLMNVNIVLDIFIYNCLTLQIYYIINAKFI